MSTFKCKMCGGTLEIQSGSTVAECEYCGAKQTLPKLDDEKRANLYDRANHFRRSNEFDKASDIYEQILNEDNTDAEAYWSLVLCRFGIEYVEDPLSHRRVPTVHRAQFTSIYDDDNYKSALKNADTYQRVIYEEEAKAINEIQKGILAISAKEEPFDVFICYKETDDSGKRTHDSVLAQDLYYQLKQEGFKVFFARITLEDKLGSAYEPYIFAALNSAKVMVVLGTKPEYFSAVWVKNEWSRYLSLIKKGEKKMLIPAYKDMDPYNLPMEFSHLQAQDMSKLGFMQDLIRGIKKIVQADAPKTTVVKETVISGGNANTASLLKRAFMFLEDGDWSSANEYCEKVLDIDPENASAYLGKLMAELNVKKQDELKNQAAPFDHSNNYQKAVRFADEKLKKVLTGYIEHINTRNENARLDGIYTNATNIMSTASTESAYKKAAYIFESIPEYRDAAALAQSCYEKAETARKDAILSEGKSKMSEGSVCDYEDAIKLFESIPGWKDADEKIVACLDGIYTKATNAMLMASTESAYKKAAYIFESLLEHRDAAALAQSCYEKAEAARKDAILSEGKSKMSEGRVSDQEAAIKLFESISGWKDADENVYTCQNKIEEIKAKEEADRLEKERLAEIARLEKEKRAKRNKRIAIIATPILCVFVGFLIVLNAVIIPNSNYNKAISLMEAGSLDEAYSIFIELGDFKDAVDKAADILLTQKYNNAVSLMEAGSLDAAYNSFIALGDYKDAAEKAVDIRLTKRYNNAVSLMEAGSLDAAYNSFIALGDYKDAADKAAGILLTKYNNAVSLMEAGSLDEAYNSFIALGDYKDAADKAAGILLTKYNNAVSLMEAGNIVDAYEALVALDGYKDSAEKAASIYDKYKVEKLKTVDVKVGDYVVFGSYEQDNNTANGKEDIEWLVLEVKDGKALVVSKYALDCKPYNTSYTSVTWETCTLREWLNSDFINSAFSDYERAMIPTVTASADKNPTYNTNPGNATQDKVFLLSITEVNKYFSSDEARKCKPTSYAVANGAYVNSSSGNCWWWLRSPGYYQHTAAYVNSGGDVIVSGDNVNDDSSAVRPALWIDLNS